jgi:pilus assembly protein CpaF
MIPQEVFEDTLLEFFAPIRPYLDDPQITEIMINGPGMIFIERKGKLYKTDAVFPDVRALVSALRNAAQFVGKAVDEERPILEGRLPDGSRVAAVLPPAAPNGPFVAIRRFFQEKLTVERLMKFGAMTQEVSEALERFVGAKLNVIIAGGTASGKTSMLNALSSYIPEGERVVIIEDSKELQLQREHVVQMEARPADAKGRGEVSIRQLFRTTLRMRPDRIVIGEIRGGEALDLIQAMTSGHGGCLTTLHATYPRDVLTRLETMSMMSDVSMPLVAMRAQIASAINLVVQVSRLRDGTRKITHVTEIYGFDHDTGTYLVQDLFLRTYQGLDAEGNVLSTIGPTGIQPVFYELMEAQGYDLPDSMKEAIWRRQHGGAQPGMP